GEVHTSQRAGSSSGELIHIGAGVEDGVGRARGGTGDNVQIRICRRIGGIRQRAGGGVNNQRRALGIKYLRRQVQPKRAALHHTNCTGDSGRTQKCRRLVGGKGVVV